MPGPLRPLAWFVTMPPVTSSDALARCNAVLDEDERARATAFRVEPARQQFIVAHALLRTLLSAWADVPLPFWRFGRGTHGKPFVVAPPEGESLAFSLAHTRGVVAAAVARDGDIGIDVEVMDRPVEINAFRSCLSATESAALLAAPLDERPSRFAKLWTAKEAVAKAVGTGISSVMAGIEIAGSGDLVSRSADHRYDGWHITHPPLGVDASAAIAMRNDGPVTVIVRTMDEWLRDSGL